ncbi:MAG: helix-turn-helix domain-containing protein [Lachnospiraceae bacterium]|nr:helix-turn-helix domain-containing protein [Lachnospiraceae bacterium]
MDTQNNSIALKIKYFRKLRNMTQLELSEASGINFGLIRKYETGSRNPKFDQLKNIANALNVSVAEFLDFDIETIGDLMSILLRLDNNDIIKFNGKKDKNGNYKPSSINISFDDDNINNTLAEYMEFKNAVTQGSTDFVITDDKSDDSLTVEQKKSMFLINDTKIKKPRE